MPDRSTKFTDSNLKLFYGNLLSHYKECTKRLGTSDVNAVYSELLLATQYAVESPQGSLNHLADRREKDKVYKSLHTIFYALPLFQQLPPDKKRTFKPLRPQYNLLINTSPPYIYDCSGSQPFNWLTLHKHLNPYLSHNKIVPLKQQPPTTLSDEIQHEAKKLPLGLVVTLALLCLVLSPAVLTLIAFYYMVYQFLNSAERLWYEEGWLRLVLMTAAAISFSSLTTALTFLFGAVPILTVALAASLNPMTCLIVVGICLTTIGASLGSLAMNSLFDFVEKRKSKKSIDSSDPSRFRLTEDDEENLVALHIDPLKVKCALVALRVEISRVLNSEGELPSFLNRHFGNTKSKQVHALLIQVRALRRGELVELSVGDLKFDCRVYRQSISLQELSLTQGSLYPKIFTQGKTIVQVDDVSPPPLISDLASSF